MEPQETTQDQSGSAVTKVKEFAKTLGLEMESQETSQKQSGSAVTKVKEFAKTPGLEMESQETTQDQSGSAVTKVKEFAARLGLEMESQETSQEQQNEWTRVELKVEQDDGEGGMDRGVSRVNHDSSSRLKSAIPDARRDQFTPGVRIKQEIDADDQTEDVQWQWDGSGSSRERHDGPNSMSTCWQRDGAMGCWRGGNSQTVNTWQQTADIGNMDVENCLRFSSEVFGSVKPEPAVHKTTSLAPTSTSWYKSSVELSEECEEEEGDGSNATFAPVTSQFECSTDIWKGNEQETNTPAVCYVCAICLKEFKKQSNWEAHTRRHRGAKPYACKLCTESYDRKSQLDLHMRGHDKYVCKFCSKTFLRKGELGRHIALHGGARDHKCKLCPKSFNRGSHLKTHMITHTTPRPFTCDLCEKAFRRKKDLDQHMAGKTHTAPKNEACTLCDEKFRMKKELHEHIKVAHTGEKPFACKQCFVAFLKEYDLELHMRRHLNGKQFQCEKCKRAFKSRGELKTHMIIHSDDRPHVCDVCSTPFKRKTSLAAHMKKAHSET